MQPNPCRGRSEAGSAYIITLLALVVLTILALALALVTQTEVQIGANEKTVNRLFYAADSGLNIAAADILVDHKYNGDTVLLNQITNAGVTTADRVTTTQPVCYTPVPCDYCPYNDDGTPKYWNITFTVSATAQRLAWRGTGAPPADATVLGQKTLSTMFRFQPWPADGECIPDGSTPPPAF